MCKMKTYLKSVFTGINLITALAITFVLLTGFVASYDFGLFGQVVQSKKAISLAIILGLIFGGATILYMALNLKNTKITFADTLAVALVFVGFIFFFYVWIATGSLNGKRIIAALFLIAAGVTYVLLRALCKNKKEKVEKTYGETSIKGYFAKIFKKFPLPLTILMSIVAVCFIYLLLSAGFLKAYFQGSRVIIALTILMLIPLMIATYKKVNSKAVNIVDGMLIPYFVALIFAFITLLVKDYSPLKMAAWAIMLGALIVVLDIRFKKFVLTEEEVPSTPVANQNYDKALFGTYSIVDVLAISATLALVSTLILRSGVIVNTFNSGKMDVGFLPVAVIIITIACIIGYGCVSALLGLKKREIGKGDFWLAVIIAFAICGFISLLFYPSKLLAYFLIVFSIFCLIVLLVRTKNLKD